MRIVEILPFRAARCFTMNPLEVILRCFFYLQPMTPVTEGEHEGLPNGSSPKRQNIGGTSQPLENVSSAITEDGSLNGAPPVDPIAELQRNGDFIHVPPVAESAFAQKAAKRQSASFETERTASHEEKTVQNLANGQTDSLL